MAASTPTPDDAGERLRRRQREDALQREADEVVDDLGRARPGDGRATDGHRPARGPSVEEAAMP